MQTREKYLVAAIVFVVLLWQGPSRFKQTFLDPVNERKRSLEDLGHKVEEAQARQLLVFRARKNLQDWTARSLPPSTRDAQRLYLEWLTDLARLSGFAELKAAHVGRTRSASGLADKRSSQANKRKGNASQRRSRGGKVYLPVRVSIDAQATYEQLCRFLDRFHRADLLHRVSELNVKSSSNTGDPKLTIKLVAEGLSMPGARKRSLLLPQTRLTKKLSEKDTTLAIEGGARFPKEQEFIVRSGHEFFTVKSISDNEWTVERGVLATKAAAHASGDIVELFCVVGKEDDTSQATVKTLLAASPFVKQGSGGKTKPGSPPKKEDPLNSSYAKSTYFRGAIEKGGKWQAWMYDASDKRIATLEKGASFEIAGLQTVVLEIERDRLVLQAGEDQWRLILGKNLNSMEKVGAPLSSKSPDSEKETKAAEPTEQTKTTDNDSSAKKRRRRFKGRFKGPLTPEMRAKLQSKFKDKLKSGKRRRQRKAEEDAASK